MAYKIELRPLAVAEIIEAYDWYELQSEGLGLAFLNEIDIFYQGILQNPNIYGFFEKPVREGKLTRFPFMVIYELFESTIVVYSVFMAKQNPTKKRAL